MRFVVLAAGLVGVAACYDDPFGAIIEASGDIEFDHVEIFLGDKAGSHTPLTPQQLVRAAMKEPIDGDELLLTRNLAADDALLATKDPRETRWNYLIPYNEQNKGLHEYALVVVSQDGVEVGAAELFHFEVPSDALHRYRIPIEPLANEDYERWGVNNDCVRWTRSRANNVATIAVVSESSNADCDAFGAEDCDQMRHCNPALGDVEASGCYAPDACLLRNAEGCGAGDCVNKIVGEKPPCEAATCIDTRLCNACDSEDPDVIAQCASTSGLGAGTHPDLGIPLMGGARTLCSMPSYDLAVPIPVECVAPDVEAVAYYYDDQVLPGPTFKFELFPGDPGTCRLHITEPFPGAPWVGTPHLVVSVGRTSGGSYRRVRFVFGVHDYGTACNETPPVQPDSLLEGCGI